jgi:guanosine-3',5'-bis(diphosphate) 3'-pyrophosphohydrolase
VSDSNSGVARLLKAVRFAAHQHRAQKRKGADATPYVNHPIEVAELLARVGGVTDENVVIAAILHDTVEDTGVAPDEIEAMFGPVVRGYVEEVTDDKSLPKEVRKQRQVEHAPHLSHGAKQLKLCDKISNIRDVANHPPADWSHQRRVEYLQWAEDVVAGLRGVNPALEAFFDESLADARSKVGRASND